MTEVLSAKASEIDRNLACFLTMLPDLVRDHDGQYALLRHGSIVEFFPTAVEAQIAGNQRFGDRVFSIQVVKEEAEELANISALSP